MSRIQSQNYKSSLFFPTSPHNLFADPFWQLKTVRSPLCQRSTRVQRAKLTHNSKPETLNSKLAAFAFCLNPAVPIPPNLRPYKDAGNRFP